MKFRKLIVKPLLLAIIFLTAVLGQNALCQPVSENLILLPRARLFDPRVADPQEIQLSARYLLDRNDFAGNMGYSVGLLECLVNDTPLQLRVEASAFLVSKLQTPNFPVQSTDYTIGFPLDLRKGAFSARLRWYHVSSHLGDDFDEIEGIEGAIDLPPGLNGRRDARPKKYAREFFELFGSYDLSGFRIYGGINWAYHIVRNASDTKNFDPWVVQFGIEWFGNSNSKMVSPYAAADFKSKREFDWETDISAQAGIVVGRNKLRRMRVALEIFIGHSSQGQFFLRNDDDINFLVAFDL